MKIYEASVPRKVEELTHWELRNELDFHTSMLDHFRSSPMQLEATKMMIERLEGLLAKCKLTDLLTGEDSNKVPEYVGPTSTYDPVMADWTVDL